MDEFVKIISHARRFNSAVKDVSLPQLEEIKGKLEGIIASRKQELEEERKEEAQKIEKITKYREMLAADGLKLDDLQQVNPVTGKKRRTKAPKYEIYVNNRHITWSGQGRMPNVFKERIDAGENLDDYLIG